nr:ABC transporter ATP-binding protein [Bacillus wiedmannii]
MKIVEVKELSKEYTGNVSHTALSNINLTITEGEFVGVMGPSGSGKTTLLNMISTIDSPTSGSVFINSKNPYQLSVNDLALFRRQELGFVFQSFNLLHTLTVKENMVLPLVLDGMNVKKINKRVESISKKLGINEILNKRTYEISGGQAESPRFLERNMRYETGSALELSMDRANIPWKEAIEDSATKQGKTPYEVLNTYFNINNTPTIENKIK